MKISRIVIKNYRGHKELDVNVEDKLCCIIGENNTGKSAIMRALQICLDVSLPAYFRSLIREDIHSSINIAMPNQVLIGIELTDFEGKVNEEALVSTWKTGPNSARIFYRFRPKTSIREQLEIKELEPGELTLDDYAWEIKGGGNPANDLLEIEWDHDGIGESVRFSDLQSFLVLYLPALRDVENDIRNPRQSPLIKLIEAFEIDQNEKDKLVDILTEANSDIASSTTIEEVSKAIDTRFKSVSGPAFEMDTILGLSAATFQAILRNLKVLLSDLSLQDFEPSRNGLGMNNILYIAILIEYLKRRIDVGKSSGQLVLIEEPEAHLHPQLQSSLIFALKNVGVQTILTSHSPQVTAQVPLSSLVSLTKRDDSQIIAGNLALNSNLSNPQIADLERYLDSTKSNLLFARKVMLVEGASELFLIPALFKKVLGVDLERQGISLIAIHGVHFDVYTKLFCDGSLEKKCAIVADADLSPSDAVEGFLPKEDAPDLIALENNYVKVFLGATTFERELLSPGTLSMFIETVRYFNAPNILKNLEDGFAELGSNNLSPEGVDELMSKLSTLVLNTAKRFGKARFAQVASRFADQCTELPKYIKDSYDWLIE